MQSNWKGVLQENAEVEIMTQMQQDWDTGETSGVNVLRDATVRCSLEIFYSVTELRFSLAFFTHCEDSSSAFFPRS